MTIRIPHLSFALLASASVVAGALALFQTEFADIATEAAPPVDGLA
jgi:hypothetical protein